MCLVHWFTLSKGMSIATIRRTQSAAGTEVQEAGCILKNRVTSSMKKVW